MALLTKRELAAELRISRRTVEALQQRCHDFPVIRLGRLCRYELEKVHAWYAAGGSLADRRSVPERDLEALVKAAGPDLGGKLRAHADRVGVETALGSTLAIQARELVGRRGVVG